MPRYELALILKVMERVDFYSNIIIWYHIIHENNTHIFDKLDSVNDLGVIFDSNLSFIDHISHKINKAYNILRIVIRNFIYVDHTRFLLLYKSMVCPLLEYANSVWCPYQKKDITEIEKV